MFSFSYSTKHPLHLPLSANGEEREVEGVFESKTL
jgi:hypothetical protein